MLENKMVMDTQWRNQEQPKRFGFENAVSQPEHSGNDYYGTEILEGDEIVIDAEGEIILKENMERYLSEVFGFQFKVAD